MTSALISSVSNPAFSRLRQGFERRASSMADIAFLHGEVQQRMLERLDYININPEQVLDLGCGTGQGLHALRTRYPQAHCTAVDCAAAMLRTALQPYQAHTLWQRGQTWLGRGPKVQGVQADFAQLPFAPAQFDVLWSNLALHWQATPHTVLPEWARVLRPEGLAMFSVWGPDTLRELRTAFAQVDGAAHTLSFTDMHDYGDMLSQSGFATPVMDMERLTVTYQSPQGLLRDVRRLGLLPMPSATGLRGKAWLANVQDALAAQRNAQGVLSLTFEIIYGHAWRALPKNTADADGVVRIGVEQIARKKPTR